jgi:acetyl-CoA carboxylase biotin carboxyl carrier protein
MELTEDDVLEILKLFEQSKFDFLQLQQGERQITVSKAGYVPAGAATSQSSTHPVRPPPATPPAAAVPPAAIAARAPAGEPSSTSTHPAIPAGLLPITAPMVGKFYAAASPSDPPYVQEGSVVTAGATIGLVEVMKVFTSIKTEIAGTIERVLVANGQFVEFGQPLFLIRPEA